MSDGDACAGGELTTSLITDLTNLNKALEGKEAGSIVELQKGAIKAGPAMRNNGGGFYNHGMFFESMTSPAKSGTPSPALAKAIDASFGSMDEMKKQFSDAAAEADRHYRLGAVPAATSVEMQRGYLDAMDSLIESRRNAWKHRMEIERLTGGTLTGESVTPRLTER